MDKRESNNVGSTTNKTTSNSNVIGKWIGAHPIETMAIALIGTTIITYEVHKHLLTDAIFEANKKTIEFMSCDHSIAF